MHKLQSSYEHFLNGFQRKRTLLNLKTTTMCFSPDPVLKHYLLSSDQLMVGSHMSPQTTADTHNQWHRVVIGETRPTDQSACAKKIQNGDETRRE